MEEIFALHKEWIKIAKYVGCPSHLVDDLVQDMYLKLLIIEEKEGSLDRLYQNDKLNKGYIFAVLSNMHSMYRRKPRSVEYMESDTADSNSELMEEKFEVLMSKVETMMGNMHWYNSKLLKTYVDENHSIRSLSKATRISARSVQHTLAKTRNQIKDECKKEYNEYRKEKNI
jgi:DNA-directed RNA polymerase specialized sigma24 family protein